jgi:hypothetical protein
MLDAVVNQLSFPPLCFVPQCRGSQSCTAVFQILVNLAEARWGAMSAQGYSRLLPALPPPSLPALKWYCSSLFRVWIVLVQSPLGEGSLL